MSDYNVIKTHLTERSGRVGKTPPSYSGNSGFKTRLQRPAILIEASCGFPQSL
jgi:hypothetical protein